MYKINYAVVAQRETLNVKGTWWHVGFVYNHKFMLVLESLVLIHLLVGT